jgi:hypothetical protein
VSIPQTGLDASRRAIRELLLHGLSRIHMRKESGGRRSQIVSAVAALDITATVYDAGRTGPDRRARCLRALVTDLATAGPVFVCLETDDAELADDRRVLNAAVRASGCRDSLTWEHVRAKEEPLLALADVVAWCWAHRGPWRDRVRHLVTEVKAA